MQQKRLYFNSYQYIVSDGMYVQGDSSRIQDVQKSGYRKLRGGNGTYLMVRPVNVRMYFNDAEGRTYILGGYEAKETILNYYGKSRISKKLVEQCVSDIANGNIEVFYINLTIRFI